jgi:hypothetical protein
MLNMFGLLNVLLVSAVIGPLLPFMLQVCSTSKPMAVQRPPSPTLHELFNADQVIDACQAAGITPATSQALLLTAHTKCCRDLHALESARVVLLLEITRPRDQTILAQAGPCVYGDDGINWLASRVSSWWWP